MAQKRSDSNLSLHQEIKSNTLKYFNFYFEIVQYFQIIVKEHRILKKFVKKVVCIAFSKSFDIDKFLNPINFLKLEVLRVLNQKISNVQSQKKNLYLSIIDWEKEFKSKSEEFKSRYDCEQKSYLIYIDKWKEQTNKHNTLIEILQNKNDKLNEKLFNLESELIVIDYEIEN